jgi:hypothetical protein
LIRRASLGWWFLGAAGLALPAAIGPQSRSAAYLSFQPLDDTLRKPDTRRSVTTSMRGMVVSGYWSHCGLPPIPGAFTLSDTGLIFHPLDQTEADAASESSPRVVSLAYIEDDGAEVHYLFRMDTGVFDTDQPGPLLEIADGPRLQLSGGGEVSATQVAVVNSGGPAALRNQARAIAGSAYADSLYALFGRPRGGIGLVGWRGRRAGRLGEYIASRDSLALDPGRMIGESQLRHALAHELGHRWQSRAKAQLTALWQGVTPIRDPKRYGYGDTSEHQAEAIAFAVNFLQTTARGGESGSAAVQLLEHYELLVPGTGVMVRYLALQPLYRAHPLRPLLTAGRSL